MSTDICGWQGLGLWQKRPHDCVFGLLTNGQSPMYIHIDEVLARHWIQRAWTVQDIILAPNP